MGLEPVEERVRTAVAAAAAHTPSSHNCQPWGLAWTASAEAKERAAIALGAGSRTVGHLLVCLRPERCLRALPAHRGEMLLSLGCLVESLALALAARRLRATVVWQPAQAPLPAPLPGWVAGWEAQACLALEEADAEAAGAAYCALGRRATVRGAFRPHLDPAGGERLLASRSEAFPAARAVLALGLETDRPRLAAVAALARRVAPRELLDGRVWRETYRWLRFGPSAEDGLTVDRLQGRPSAGAWRRRALQVALWPPLFMPLAALGLGAAAAAGTARRLAAGPALLTLGAAADQAVPWLAAGALLQAAWLQAAAQGWALHPVSVLLQHPDAAAELAQILGAGEARLLFVARTGVPVEPTLPAAKLRHPWLLVRQR